MDKIIKVCNLCYEYSDEQFAEATRAEAIRMRDELNGAIKIK